MSPCLFQLLLRSLIVVGLVLPSATRAEGQRPEPQPEWCYHAEIKDAVLAARHPLSDDAAAVWAGILAYKESTAELYQRLVTQVESSSSVSFRNLAFLTVAIACRDELSKAKALLSKHAARFPQDFRFGYLQILLDASEDLSTYEKEEPKPKNHRQLAERLLALLDLQSGEEMSPRQDDLTYEMRRYLGVFTEEEIMGDWTIDYMPRFQESMLQRNDDHAERLLPFSKVALRQNVSAWLGGLGLKLDPTDFAWLQRQTQERGLKINWDFLHKITAVDAQGRRIPLDQGDNDRLMLAVKGRYFDDSDKIPWLFSAFERFHEKRPALAALAGLNLAGRKDAAHPEYLDKAIMLIEGLPSVPPTILYEVRDILCSRESRDPSESGGDWARREHALVNILISPKGYPLIQNDVYFLDTIGLALARERRWSELFGYWENWLANPPPPFKNGLSVPIPWLALDGATPSWITKQLELISEWLPVASMEDGGEEAEQSYLQAARLIKNPWLRYTAIRPVARGEAKQWLRDLAQSPQLDFIGCMLLADEAPPEQVNEWLDRAQKLKQLTAAEQAAVDGRRVFSERPDYSQASARKPSSQVKAALERLKDAVLTVEEVDHLEEKCRSDWSIHPSALGFIPQLPFRKHPFVNDHGIFDRDPPPKSEIQIRNELRSWLRPSFPPDEALRPHAFGPLRQQPAPLIADDPRGKLLKSMLSRVAERSPRDRVAAAVILYHQGAMALALAQLKQAIVLQPDQMEWRVAAFELASQVNDEETNQAFTALNQQQRRSSLVYLMGLPPLQPRVLELIVTEAPNWKDLTEEEGERLLDLVSSWPFLATKLSRDGIIRHLLTEPTTAMKAWRNHRYAIRPQTPGHPTALESAMLARQAILTDPAGGFSDYGNEIPSTFLGFVFEQNDHSLLSSLCEELEQQQHAGATRWRLREKVCFGEQADAFTAMSEFASKNPAWKVLLQEVSFACATFEQRAFTRVDVSALREKLWELLRDLREPEIAETLVRLHEFDFDESALFRLVKHSAGHFLIPPQWALRGLNHANPDDLTMRGSNKPDVTAIRFAKSYQCYRSLCAGLAMNPKWTWRVWQVWRKEVFGYGEPNRPDWDTSRELVFRTGSQPYTWVPELFRKDPKMAIQFLKDSPFFNRDWPFDPVIELLDSEAEDLESAFMPDNYPTLLGMVLHAVQKLPPAAKKDFAAGLTQIEQRGFGRDLFEAVLNDTSPAAAFENLGQIERPITEILDPRLLSVQRFMKLDLPRLFPQLTEQLQANPAAQKVWEALQHGLKHPEE